MRILVKRTGALGDVVLTTPIIRRLRKENPNAMIDVHTAYPRIFTRNFANTHMQLFEGDRLVDLDFAYERRPTMHIVDAYMQKAFDDPGEPEDKQQKLDYNRDFDLRVKNAVAVHAAVAGWKNRTLPKATWMMVAAGIRQAGLWPILVGTPHDYTWAGATTFHDTDVLVQAALIAQCRCFVGSDTGLLHVAGATDVPIVGVFTCARPEYRLPYRRGVLGGRCMAVLPVLDCVGCLERVPPPITTETCERGDIACVGAVKAQDIVDAVLHMVETSQ